MNRLLVLLILSSSLVVIGRSQSKTMQDMIELRNQYKVADGAKFLELNPKLSKFLVLNDSIYFQVMSEDNSTFKRWVSDLSTGTFTVFNFEDPVDSIMQLASLTKLKELMLSKVSNYVKKDQYKAAAKK